MYQITEHEVRTTTMAGNRVCIVESPGNATQWPIDIIMAMSTKKNGELAQLPLTSSASISSTPSSSASNSEGYSVNIPLLSKQTKTFSDKINCRGCQKSFPCSYGGKRTTPAPEYYIHCIEICDKYKALGLIRECMKCRTKFLSKQALGTHQKICTPAENNVKGKGKKGKKKGQQMGQAHFADPCPPPKKGKKKGPTASQHLLSTNSTISSNNQLNVVSVSNQLMQPSSHPHTQPVMVPFLNYPGIIGTKSVYF